MTVDPGLQRERTALAWGRTALSTAALGLLLVRLGLTHDRPLEVGTGAGALLTAGVLALTGRTDIQDRHRAAPAGVVCIGLAAISVSSLLVLITS